MTSRGIIQLVVTFAMIFVITFAGATDTSLVPVADDLTVLGLQSNQQKLPILIMYAAENCQYCERLEEELLGPMVMNSQYQKRVIIRKVMIDGYGDIKDFNGKTIDVENFAFKHGIQVTPTLQFVDAKGHQLAPEMVGYNTPEMYPAYLDNAIEESQRAITLAP